jgi:hypothetical protein
LLFPLQFRGSALFGILMPIRISMLLPIRIGIKTMPIRMRILLKQVVNFYLLGTFADSNRLALDAYPDPAK